MAMQKTSLATQNFATETADAINQQIQVEQQAQHTYLACAAYFGRDDVALPGLQKHFLEEAERQGKRAQMLIDYQTTRGGTVIIKELAQPPNEFTSAQNAVETSLQLEKDVNKSLFNLTTIAANMDDIEFVHHLKRLHLTERIYAIEKVAKALTQLERVGGEGLGLHLWDAQIYQDDGNYPVGVKEQIRND